MPSASTWPAFDDGTTDRDACGNRFVGLLITADRVAGASVRPEPRPVVHACVGSLRRLQLRIAEGRGTSFRGSTPRVVLHFRYSVSPSLVAARNCYLPSVAPRSADRPTGDSAADTLRYRPAAFVPTDTTDDVRRRHRSVIAALSPARRVELAVEMSDLARRTSSAEAARRQAHLDSESTASTDVSRLSSAHSAMLGFPTSSPAPLRRSTDQSRLPRWIRTSSDRPTSLTSSAD